MENITFTATFTFNKSSIETFARTPVAQGGLGYQDNVVKIAADPITGLPTQTTIANSEGVFDFIARLAKEHNEKFVTKWANFIVQGEVQKQVDIIQPQVETAILQPVKDAIQVTYTSN